MIIEGDIPATANLFTMVWWLARFTQAEWSLIQYEHRWI